MDGDAPEDELVGGFVVGELVLYWSGRENEPEIDVSRAGSGSSRRVQTEVYARELIPSSDLDMERRSDHTPPPSGCSSS